MATNPINNFSIQNEKNVTKQDVIKEADEIYNACKKRWGGRKQSPNELDDLFEDMRVKHKDFYMAYPTVLRHMIQDMQYNHRVFAKYMDKVEKKPPTKDDERMDSYADYATMLFRHYNKSHMNLTTINLFRTDYRKRLQKEHDDFKNLVDKMQKEVEQKEEQLDSKKRDDLLEVFKGLSSDLGPERIAEVENLVLAGVIKTSALEDMVYDIKRMKYGVATYEQIAQEKGINTTEFKKRLEQVDTAAKTEITMEEPANDNEREELKRKMVLLCE